MHFHVASRGSPLTLASQQVGHVLNVPIKSLNFPRSLSFYKLNSYQATQFLSFQKIFCFGGFIVTTFIMLILIEN